MKAVQIACRYFSDEAWHGMEEVFADQLAVVDYVVSSIKDWANIDDQIRQAGDLDWWLRTCKDCSILSPGDHAKMIAEHAAAINGDTKTQEPKGIGPPESK